MTTLQLPQYFSFYGGTAWFSCGGDRVYGTLSVEGSVVTYRFNSGNGVYEDSREFGSESAAIKFASKFAAEMRRCDKRNSVMTSSTFRSF